MGPSAIAAGTGRLQTIQLGARRHRLSSRAPGARSQDARSPRLLLWRRWRPGLRHTLGSLKSNLKQFTVGSLARTSGARAPARSSDPAQRAIIPPLVASAGGVGNPNSGSIGSKSSSGGGPPIGSLAESPPHAPGRSGHGKRESQRDGAAPRLPPHVPDHGWVGQIQYRDGLSADDFALSVSVSVSVAPVGGSDLPLVRRD